ncbi:hypothetical protein U879_02425 [Defluviimonas sp. 20V17]|nr:hypothetical protein U879_02425 [Defluviimonas sp. 20V17]
MPFIYSPDALFYDSAANAWSLRPDYDPKLHRVEITFSDDDGKLSGDNSKDEVGADANQTAEVRDWEGNLISSGLVYDEEAYEVVRPDSTHFRIDRLEIGGQHVGYVTTDLLEPGVTYSMYETENVYEPGGEEEHSEDNRLSYTQIADVPCFLAGTSVMTEQGMVPVDWLRPGDRLLTRDRGFQPLLWVGRFELGQTGEALPAESRPVEIEAGALGAGQPATKLRVSPQHRLLLQHPQMQLCFGHEAMFCAADFLTGRPGVSRPHRRGPAIYYHLLLPHHAAVLSDGQWTESLFLGDQMEEIVPAAERTALRRRADAAGLGHEVTAYPCLRRWEVALLTPPQVKDDTDDLSCAWTEEGARARA